MTHFDPTALFPAAGNDEPEGDPGIKALHHHRRKVTDDQPFAWAVYEGEDLISYWHRRRTLDQVIREVVADYEADEQAWHQAIWLGPQLMAVVRPGRKGRAEVVRLAQGAIP